MGDGSQGQLLRPSFQWALLFWEEQRRSRLSARCVSFYLPLKDKIELVNNVINQSVDDNGFYNPIRVKLYMTLEIVYAYTNISFILYENNQYKFHP